MAWSQAANTLLSLNEWASILGIDLFTFNQIGSGFPSGSSIGVDSGSCNNVWFNEEWQFNNISRSEVAKAIANAEDMLAKRLGFYPAPKFIYQEKHQYPIPRTPYAWGGGAWSWGWGFPYALPKVPSVQLNFTKVLGGGILARTFIADTINLTLIDSTTGIAAVAPAINDMFTCSVATTITDTSEIGAYFRAADRSPINNAITETWRVRPIDVSITGGVATITGHSSLLVKPQLETIVNPVALDVTIATNFVSQLSVYRVYRDDISTDSQGIAFWENLTDNCADDPPCTLSEASLCIGDRNGSRGQVFVGFTEADCCLNWRNPDQVLINYLSGERLVNNRINPDYARQIAYLAASLLPSESCGCQRSDRLINYWREDVTNPPNDQAPRMLTEHELRSPFGFTRGSLYVWNRIPENENFIGINL